MPIADKFYAIYNRCSLPVDNSASVTDDNGFCYSPVESVYDTLASLKADTEKYFTKEYLDSTFYKNLADETAFYKDITASCTKTPTLFPTERIYGILQPASFPILPIQALPQQCLISTCTRLTAVQRLNICLITEHIR